MDSNISELVKLGHERADELKAACGAVDVRSVAQLISDLASQLEVQYVRAEESRREFRSADITMQNLEAKCEKLAAENAGLIRSSEILLHEASEVYRAYNKTQLPDGDLVDEQSLQEVYAAINATPTTDAFLAEVRAQGVEMFAGRILASAKIARDRDEMNIADSLDGEAVRATIFANELRQEVK